MPKNLLIVESPAKSKTLKKFLGNDFEVLATVGHIIDLPKSKTGVDVENNFKPDYVVIEGKDKIIKQLRAAAKKVDHIYLAPDPDREGEAIAWHVANSLKKARGITAGISRIAFNAITRKAVTEAFDHAREIDMNLVNAQQARRILDRIVGYEVSPFLWKTLAWGLSAGRVQSVALRIVCERESEVLAFIPQEYWEIEAEFANQKKQPFTAKLAKIDGKKPELGDQESTDKVLAELKEKNFTVSDIKIGTKKRNPLPPFITSTLQQEAATKLGFAPNKTMRVAQALYEGIDLKTKEGTVGLITYMRTDSVRIEPDAIKEARSVIKSKYGEEYLPDSPRVFKTKKSAQDAHEAIRPTYLEYSPDKLKRALTKDRLKLYTLIWDRFLASQMNPAVYDTVAVDITADQYLFRANSLNLKFDGYLRVYKESESNGKNGNGSGNKEIPPLNKGEAVSVEKFNPSQHFTKPPARFSEASLVKELEAQGIGRPSTYAQIIATLKSRKYVDLTDRRLIPTELGFAVTKILVDNLENLFDVSFTANMELELDGIEEGKVEWTDVMSEFYNPFSKNMEALKGKTKEIKESLIEKTDEKCENCGSDMVIKWGRNGRFFACSGYPECKTTRPLEEEEVAAETDIDCEKCGAKMVVKNGRFGKFLGCSNYPKCRHTQPITTGVKCPKDGCEGEIVERKSKRGRVFFGCTNYPKCDFASWNQPVNQPCKACGHIFIVEKTTKAKGLHHYCPECKTVSYPEAEKTEEPKTEAPATE
ncbi:MAG: type I DNA topoisomerase [candidate division Zixibacteria bacterium]|nr:type I DNA topoisomerase [candidate division Zixibacteria bacterium]